MLVDSFSRLRCIGLDEDNDPENPGCEYGKSIFDTNKNIVCGVDSNQNIKNEIEMNGSKYCLDEKDQTKSSISRYRQTDTQ